MNRSSEKYAPGPWVHLLEENKIVRNSVAGNAGTTLFCSVEYIENKSRDRYKWVTLAYLNAQVNGPEPLRTVLDSGYCPTQGHAMTEALKTAQHAGGDVDFSEVVW